MVVVAESKLESPIEPIEASASHEHDVEGIDKVDLIRIAVVGAAALIGWLSVPYANLVGIAATICGGWPIFEEAFSNLRQRRMTMELSMSIALIAALAISEVFTALIIAFFVLIAECLEKLTVGRGRSAIQHLLSHLPQNTLLRQGDQIVERALVTIKLGDTVLIKPGASVPVDGVVVSGHSYVDQSAITGESLPVEKVAGATVYAGTMNQSGTLDVSVTGIGADTAYGKIIHAVENAERYQAPVQKLADRLAGYLVYFALGCALLTFLITHNITSTISVVIVAGACGIAAGTPLAILGGIGQAARAGSIVKGGLFLESLAKVDTVVFDKTGTLTRGTPETVAIESLAIDSVAAGECPLVSETEVLRLAASAESMSEHPLGRAIIESANRQNVPISRPEKFAYVPGRGITCNLDGAEVIVGNRKLFEQKNYNCGALPIRRHDTSEVLVGRANVVCGVIHIADVIRAEAKQAVCDLRSMGIKPILLTGDSKAVADSVANSLGITDVNAEVLPSEKQDYIKKLAASGSRVAMVGDGINDAPALVEASVGIAVGSGTDVARESADIVLIGTDLRRFVETIRIARRCKRIIMANFFGTLAVDGIGVGLAAFGMISPMVAAFIHVSSELLFIMNSARLLPALQRPSSR